MFERLHVKAPNMAGCPPVANDSCRSHACSANMIYHASEEVSTWEIHSAIELLSIIALDHSVVTSSTCGGVGTTD